MATLRVKGGKTIRERRGSDGSTMDSRVMKDVQRGPKPFDVGDIPTRAELEAAAGRSPGTRIGDEPDRVTAFLRKYGRDYKRRAGLE